MIDRNALLVEARTAFLRAYLDAFDLFLPKSIEDAFKKADTSRSSLEQSHYLTVRGVLRERQAELRLGLQHCMDKLLNRSLQTTYSTFRPDFKVSGHEDALSLVDTSEYEGELRLVAFTDRFRNESAEQLRDLNIRIALLFGQDDIKERENPFRPYLVSRSLADASEGMMLPKDLTHVLTQVLAESMEVTIDGIYASINAFLAQNGIAAELPLRIKKSADQTPPVVAPDANAITTQEPMASGTSPAATYPSGPAGVGVSGQRVQSVEQFLQSIKTMVDNVSTQTAAPMATTPYSQASSDNLQTDIGQAAVKSQPFAVGSHEQKVDQLLNMVKRYSEASPGFGSVSGSAAGMGQVPGGSQSMPSPASNLPPSGPGSAGWLSGVQKVGEVLRKFLGSSGVQGASAKAYTPAAAPPRVLTVQLAQVIDTLMQVQTPATADMLASNGEVRNLILEQRPHLSEQTQEVDEQMTIDVVAMLFEFILRDMRVPAEVRAQLGRLQFLVLKLALRDPSFLTQKAHPARMLINRIGSISVGLKKIDPSSERVSAEICLIVETLLHDATKNPDMFAALFVKLLDDFDEFVAAELRSTDEKLNRAVQAIENVQNRTLRFAHISAQMAEILSGVKLDIYLHEFLSNTWVQVIERAEGIDMARAKRFRALVPDLIWSIAPKAEEYDREEMSVILPIMLSTLREGLALIAWPEAQQKELLGWLFDAHNRALRSIVDKSFQIPSLPLMHTNFERLVDNMPIAHTQITPDAQSSAERALMDAMLRELNADIQSLDHYFVEEADHEVSAMGADTAAGNQDALMSTVVHADVDASIIERLHSGIYIEINISQTPSRARLSWISADARNLILNLDGQHTPVLISLRAFRRLVTSRRVRFIEDQPLFERAVQSLLDSAEEIDQVELV